MLARRVRGRSQQERAIRGIERGSQAKWWLGFIQPVSDDQHRECRFTRAIRNPCERQVCHSCLCGVTHVVRTSIARGIRVFSIAIGLGSEGDLFRGFGMKPPGGQGLR